MSVSYWVVLSSVLLSLSHLSSGDPYLTLVSTGPAVLDSPIQFTVELKGVDEKDGPFIFRWSDNASPAHWKEEVSKTTQSNYTLTYSSKQYESSRYKMTVIAYEQVAIFREEVAQKSLKFDITKQLNGQLVVNKMTTKRKSGVVVSSSNKTNVEVIMYDPLDYLKDAKLVYYWFINDTNYGMTDGPVFSYEFTHLGISDIEVTVLAYFANSSSSAQSASPAEVVKNSPPGVKYGLFRTKLESRAPMNKVNVSGKTWLNHGELLDLNLSCDGSGPWTYCWSIKDNNYNITGNETCLDPEILLNSCSFPIMWYFRQDGIFDILVLVSNGLTMRRELIHVNIYEVYPQPSIMFVVLPTISVLVIITVMILGVYGCIKFKQRLNIEIADFDFNVREETLEYKTFWERLRDSMVNAFGSSSGDTVSHVSSVSSRSGLGGYPNVAGIHYGSIT